MVMGRVVAGYLSVTRKTVDWFSVAVPSRTQSAPGICQSRRQALTCSLFPQGAPLTRRQKRTSFRCGEGDGEMISIGLSRTQDFFFPFSEARDRAQMGGGPAVTGERVHGIRRRVYRLSST